MWRRLEHEKRLLRNWDCSLSFDEYWVSVYEYDKLKGRFTYPKCDNYEEFADKVFKRAQTMIMDITFHQGSWGDDET